MKGAGWRCKGLYRLITAMTVAAALKVANFAVTLGIICSSAMKLSKAMALICHLEILV